VAVTILKLACPDRVGLLARLTGFVAGEGGNLIEVNQFTDPISGWFFTRMAIDSATLRIDLSGLREIFQPLATELDATWSLRSDTKRMRVIILVSRLGHCLADLLWRWRVNELPMEIALVVSNHEDLRDTVEREKIRFVCVPTTGNKRESFARINEMCSEAEAELIVLARYMQILPVEMCARYAEKIINIHHSFLPSFIGANPYQRAYERGVKLIGATCHYATSELDAGPIIDQEVVRVEHFHTPEDLLRLGRDCERLALARGVRYHLQDRVLVHGNRSIVFRH
jgi:formyltetrahydrofolate deformylase